MKIIIKALILLVISVNLYAQKYTAESGAVSFFSEAPLENIEAHNNEAKSIFDADNGNIVFSIPIKGFTFAKSLMQEHFNENYLESDKYPNATFEGKIINFQKKSGEQKATAKGTMTIHGVSKEVEIAGTINMKEDKIVIDSKFPLKVADYEIEIPKIVFYNIAEEVEVSAEFTYKPFQTTQ